MRPGKAIAGATKELIEAALRGGLTEEQARRLSRLGPEAVTLCVTIGQIVDILSYHLQTNVTPGGLIDAWQQLAEVLNAWYKQIGEEAKGSAHLHADETG